MPDPRTVHWIDPQPDRVLLHLPGRSRALPLHHQSKSVVAGQNAAVSNAIFAAAKRSADGLIENPEASRGHVQRDFARHSLPGLVKQIGGYHKALRDADRQHKAALAEWLKPPNVPGEYLFAKVFEMLKGRRPAEVIILMHEDATVAHIAFTEPLYRLLGLPAAGRAELERTVRSANIIRTFENSAVGVPSMHDPLGERPNLELAGKLAASTIKGLTDAKDDVDGGVLWLDSVLDFAAILSDRTKSELFNQVVKAA